MKKILVIEDDFAIQSLTVKALQSRGFRTLTAPDGLAGLEVARQQMPDLIICDIQMPRMNGYETLSELRKDPLTATIPFIFLTGLTERREMRQGMGLGADDYLTKPFSVNELMQVVQTRLEKQAALQQRSERKLEDLRGNIGMALPHELLTPLNGILGFTSILMDEGLTFSPDEIRDFARNIQVSALRLHRIIENFIIFSETELVKGSPEKLAELRAADPIQVGQAIETLAGEKAASFSRENDLALEVEDAFVPVGSGYFLKIVGEVIDNAFKFSQLGSPVRVTGNVAGKRYRLTVSDRGRGMTPQQIADVGAHMQFERRFYEQQGVGLGLIVARRLADLHGGGLLIDSKPGEYTTVILDLPLQGEAAVTGC